MKTKISKGDRRNLEIDELQEKYTENSSTTTCKSNLRRRREKNQNSRQCELWRIKGFTLTWVGRVYRTINLAGSVRSYGWRVSTGFFRFLGSILKVKRSVGPTTKQFAFGQWADNMIDWFLKIRFCEEDGRRARASDNVKSKFSFC